MREKEKVKEFLTQVYRSRDGCVGTSSQLRRGGSGGKRGTPVKESLRNKVLVSTYGIFAEDYQGDPVLCREPELFFRE